MADESDESEWRFSIDEVGDDADDASDEADDGDGSGTTILGRDDDGPTVKVGGQKTATEELSADDEGEGIAGPVALKTEVESGTPDLENALFVALGVFLMVFVISSMVVRLDVVGVFGLGAVVAVLAGGLYEFFRRF
jgi:hypothetical protein